MKKIIFVLFCLVWGVCAHAAPWHPGPNYYAVRTTNCSRAAMRRALDRATVARRAVITVVTCEPGHLGKK